MKQYSSASELHEYYNLAKEQGPAVKIGPEILAPPPAHTHIYIVFTIILLVYSSKTVC